MWFFKKKKKIEWKEVKQTEEEYLHEYEESVLNDSEFDPNKEYEKIDYKIFKRLK